MKDDFLEFGMVMAGIGVAIFTVSGIVWILSALGWLLGSIVIGAIFTILGFASIYLGVKND